MNIRVPLLLGCLFALSSQAQESKRALWTWTDANGVTHFSDRPVPGARQVEIATTIPPPPQVATPEPASAATSARRRRPPRIHVSSLEIWQPQQNGESFFGADVAVERARSVGARAGARGTRYCLYLDGKLVEAANERGLVHAHEPPARRALACGRDHRRAGQRDDSQRAARVSRPAAHGQCAGRRRPEPAAAASAPAPTVPGNRAPRGG